MHSGLIRRYTFAKLAMISLVLLNIGCKDKNTTSLVFSSPEQGQSFNSGDIIKVQLDAGGAKLTGASYFLDGKPVGEKADSSSISIPTKGLPLGYRLITAIVKQGDKADTLSTNIILKTDQKPVQLTYKVINTFPHDTRSYTEGLSYVDGKLLESTGEKGASELKWVDLKSGKALQTAKLDPQYFGEGSLKIGDKIIMLTWQENIGFIFDAKTFKQIGTFPYQNSREGWGLAFDGTHILRTDGSNRIWRMNAQDYKEESYLEVYDNKGPVNSLNELEFINGKIYANVYLTNKIVRIDPQSGIVEAEVDLSALVPQNYFKTADEEQNNVLNGIAWDNKGKRMFVGGKKWPKLYEIKLN